jgi:hypothetical protein
MRSRVPRCPWRPPPLTRAFAPARHPVAAVATAYELVVPSAHPRRPPAPPAGAAPAARTPA